MTTPAPRAPDDVGLVDLPEGLSALVTAHRDLATQAGAMFLSRGDGEARRKMFDAEVALIKGILAALASARRDAVEAAAAWCASHILTDTNAGRVFAEVNPDRMVHHVGADYAEALRVLLVPPSALGGAAARCPSCGQEKGCAAVCADSPPHEGSAWSMCHDPYHSVPPVAGEVGKEVK